MEGVEGLMSNENIPISIDQIALSNMYQNEALLRLLAKEHIITKEEFDKEIGQIKIELQQKRKQN